MDFGYPVGTLCSELAKLNHTARGRATEIFGLTATGSPNRSVSLVPLIGQKRRRCIF